MLRIILFMGTNIAILFVLNITMRIFGLDKYLAGTGSNYTSLLIFAAAFGFIGSFISLAMSKSIAKRSMGCQIIENPSNDVEAWLVETVRKQAKDAGIGMPEVAIFDQPVLNAFATGMNRNNALVAVSTGLLQGMRKEEVEAVLAHEVSHVANGDMVTMALIQGIINTFVIFFARIIGQIIDRAVFKSESGRGPGYFITSIVAELVLGFLASFIVKWFSRRREFRADEGGANLSTNAAMIAALQRLQGNHAEEELPDQLAAFGIFGRRGAGWKKLLSTHPPLSERIAALQARG